MLVLLEAMVMIQGNFHQLLQFLGEEDKMVRMYVCSYLAFLRNFLYWYETIWSRSSADIATLSLFTSFYIKLQVLVLIYLLLVWGVITFIHHYCKELCAPMLVLTLRTLWASTLFKTSLIFSAIQNTLTHLNLPVTNEDENSIGNHDPKSRRRPKIKKKVNDAYCYDTI